jgi:hypothetical protein
MVKVIPLHLSDKKTSLKAKSYTCVFSQGRSYSSNVDDTPQIAPNSYLSKSGRMLPASSDRRIDQNGISSSISSNPLLLLAAGLLPDVGAKLPSSLSAAS